MKMILGSDSIYNLFWVDNSDGHREVGVLLAEKWIDKVC